MTTDEDRVLRAVWREIKSYRLSGIEKFVGERDNFIFIAFIYSKPVTEECQPPRSTQPDHLFVGIGAMSTSETLNQ